MTTDLDLDRRLHDAGTRWRAGITVDAEVPELPDDPGRSMGARAVLALGAVGLVVAISVAVLSGGWTSPIDGSGSVPASAAPRETAAEPTGTASALSATPAATPVIESDCPGGTVDVGPAQETPEYFAVVEAVNTDPDNFDSIYFDVDGVLVIQYVGENAGRAAVEKKLNPDMEVRWVQVRYSKTELRRIQDEIVGRELVGVYWVGSGSVCNAVTVGVDEDSIDEIRQLLAEAYGDAVHIVASGPVIAQ
jgi:hypothetical protein